MNPNYCFHVFLSLLGVFIAALSQLFLKKSANKEHDSLLKEYLNFNVIFGYILMLISTFLALIAYRMIPVSLGMVFESTSYIYIFLFDYFIFGKKIQKNELYGVVIIIIGIIVFSLSM